MLRRPATAALISIVVLGLVGCSSTPPAAQSGASSTMSPTPTVASTLPAAFTGEVDDFYAAPKSLTKAPPGTLIRYQDVAEDGDSVTWRILYHSVDAAGRDQAVPGMVTFPKGDAPVKGWPVLSIAPGTVGLDTSCALSRNTVSVDGFGLEGVIVRTDYIGMVDGQTQRYLSGVSEAHSVIDAVRAARNIPAAHAGKRWVVFGHSQGGHSALFTNQLARTWAPELELLGAVVGAPAAELTRTFGPDDQIVPRVVEIMGLFGIAADHPGTDPESYLTPEAKKLLPLLEDKCLAEITVPFGILAAQRQLFAKDPLTTEPAASFVKENDPGTVKSPTPILLFGGTKDIRVVPARTAALRKQLCSLGQVTQFLNLPGANHGTETPQASKQIASWIAARFAGQTAPDNCPAGG